MRTLTGRRMKRKEANRLVHDMVDPEEEVFIEYKPKHEFQTLHHYHYGDVEVDVLMVPLIRRMWQYVIATEFCCQGDPTPGEDQTIWDERDNRAYLLLPRTTRTMKFAQLLMVEFAVLQSDKVSWTFEFDRNPYDEHQRICLRFPQQDIPLIMEFLDDRADIWQSVIIN